LTNLAFFLLVQAKHPGSVIKKTKKEIKRQEEKNHLTSLPPVPILLTFSVTYIEKQRKTGRDISYIHNPSLSVPALVLEGKMSKITFRRY